MVDWESEISEVNKARLRLAVEALRSGEYEQGHGALCQFRNGERKYCCLGVLTDVARTNGLNLEEILSETMNMFLYSGEGSYLPPQVRDWYGLPRANPLLDTEQSYADDESPYTATSLNDHFAKDFNFIADAFERTYKLNESDESN